MKPSVVFFGSGPVAAKSLRLLTADFEIEAVVTKPATAKEMAGVAADENIYAVSTRLELDELFARNPFESRLAILIDFGIIVSQQVIDYFPLGIVNSHFSLLPEWRGADPITFAILSGQERTGVSLMLLVEAMDEGPLLAQAPYDIPEGCTAPQLTKALIELSAESLKHIMPLYLHGEIAPRPQEAVAPGKMPTYSRKLTKEDGIIDWSKPAEQIEREIRAFLAWPKSRTRLADKDVVITAASVVKKHIGEPGAVSVEDKQLLIACGSGALRIERLKPAGKREMTAQEFLAGYSQKLGDRS